MPERVKRKRPIHEYTLAILLCFGSDTLLLKDIDRLYLWMGIIVVAFILVNDITDKHTY